MQNLNPLCLECALDCKQRSFIKIISCNFQAKSLAEKVNGASVFVSDLFAGSYSDKKLPALTY